MLHAIALNAVGHGQACRQDRRGGNLMPVPTSNGSLAGARSDACTLTGWAPARNGPISNLQDAREKRLSARKNENRANNFPKPEAGSALEGTTWQKVWPCKVLGG
eukprot:1159908-Pelagomonas_calceolata.AAC.4